MFIFLLEATGGSAATVATMAGLLAEVTSILSSAVGWVNTIATTIANTPILLLGVVLPFVGFGVGLLRRMLRL